MYGKAQTKVLLEDQKTKQKKSPKSTASKRNLRDRNWIHLTIVGPAY